MTGSSDRVVEALRASVKENEQLRQQQQALLATLREPIAIIGMACRFPGGVDSPQDLWGLLERGEDGISGFPSDRGWDLERLYDPDPDTPGTSYARDAGFLSDPAGFDAEFFGISPREALAMDPQQRLLLEACWEALEGAGIDPASLHGSATGVFAGLIQHGYGTGDLSTPEDLEGYRLTGVSTSVASGRIAYALGLEGPAMTVDTACSSSLVTLHLAAQALRAGECSLALAGGATVMATPSVFTEFSRQRGLAPDGRCKSFAEAADGTGWSEGVGMLLVSRLSDAQRAGHPILAVLKGSAVNQDGASNGLTAPNGPSQQRVIAQALASAGLEPSEVDAVEAHGTGTTLGDPIEAGALLATYGQQRERPLALGSIKSNIGHAQAAAGVAGVIKMVLAMREGVLPKTLHIDAPSSHVQWSEGNVELLSEARPWAPNGAPRRAGVSSFGISGTNAHVILEEAPKQEAKETATEPKQSPLSGPIALPLSAKSSSALSESASRLSAQLQADPELDLGDVAYSLTTSRSSLSKRAVILGADRKELLSGLGALAKGTEANNLSQGTATERQPVFLFPGQGAQRAGMALELYRSSPAFAHHIDECEQALEPYVEWSLREVLQDPEGNWLDRLDIVQPALFATMVSLARLWEELGVVPTTLIGHSQGEIAAAHIAAGLSLDDAARVIALRGKAMASIAGKGAMASVSLPPAQLSERLVPYGKSLSLAAINGPASVVISGEPEAIAEILTALDSEDIRAQKIAVDYAAHSAQIEALEDELLSAFGPISPQSGQIPFHSTVSGEPIDTAELDAHYWYRNLRETVRLEPVLRSLLEAGQRSFIEVGPHPVLAFGLQETIDQVLADPSEAMVLGTLRREEDGPERFALSLAQAHTAGIQVNWAASHPGAKRVPLPTYPFQRSRYWLKADSSQGDPRAQGQALSEHPMLGAAIALPEEEGWLHTGRLCTESHPWLADHAVFDTVLLPGTAFLELALHAAHQAGLVSVEELTLQAPLILSPGQAVALQVAVGSPDQEGNRQISIHSRPEGAEAQEEWTRHASGSLSPQETQAPQPLTNWPPEGAQPIEAADLYERLAEAGFQYGPAFQGLSAAWRDGEEIYAEVALAPEQREAAGAFSLHPALLDSALHAALIAALQSGTEEEMRLPFSWNGVSLTASGASELRVQISKATSQEAGEGAISIAVSDQNGEPVASAESLQGRAISTEQLVSASQAQSKSLFALHWSPAQLEDEGQAPESIRWAHLGEADSSLITALDGEPQSHPDLETLAKALEQDEEAPLPELVLCEIPSAGEGETPHKAKEALEHTLALAQQWIASERLASSRLVLITTGAVAAKEGEDPDLGQAPVWGLIRSAQMEHPERFGLIDTDGTEDSLAALPKALAALESEPQLALREGVALAGRLRSAQGSAGHLTPPQGPWRLDAPKRGTLEGLELIESPAATAPLGPAEVRIEMRAAGLNFRDVLSALDLYPGEATIGGEGAGVVSEVGSEVTDLHPGQRVMGMIPEAFGPIAVTEQRLLTEIPPELSFEQAAAVPITFLTASYALSDLASLKRGERVLIHAGAGGVGMAAIQLATRAGAEVFATASPSKWEALKELGIGEDHLASSRDLHFKDKFLATSEGKGMDVVLNALAGEFVDASLELLPNGGRFLEMGKTDVREAKEIQTTHPNTTYRAFDLMEAGPERIGEMLTELAGLLGSGELRCPPITTWEMQGAPAAFRHLREGKNLGKVVLTLPSSPDPDSTVLITGGTGGLGALLAEHLVTEQGAEHLLLVSRSGEEAQGAPELAARLQEQGAKVRIAACDVADKEQLKALLDSIPTEHPLGTVIHAAGVLDDGVIETLDPERLQRVMGPKANAAHHLHELTKGIDLDAFVMFSSIAGIIGGPGQGNYAAANSFLDALAQHRRAQGLVATSIAWGPWESSGGMTSTLTEADLTRMKRGGIEALSPEQGLELYDLSRQIDQALLLPVRLDNRTLRSLAKHGMVPPLLRGLIKAPTRRAGQSGSFARTLASVPEGEREAVALEFIRTQIATVLGHDSPQAIAPQQAFKDMGFDSLAAVELRNRLAAATGMRLPATLVFDYPTPTALASHLLSEATASGAAKPLAIRATASEEPIAIIAMACRYPGGVSSPEDLWRLLEAGEDGISQFPTDRGWDLERLYDPDPDTPGTSYAREGGFLHEAADFDAEFFGISPREALATDPQQRLLLEACWEALEGAGIDPASLHGSATGVFAGLSSQDYTAGLQASQNLKELEGYFATGASGSVLSGRIAYTFGLEGPAMTVDTACSSSLVALHLAAQALRAGECTLALAGGATILSTPGLFTEFSRQRGLAPDGRCKSFADSANGAGFSEGVGMLLVSRLSDAQRQGHPILAVLKGSAVNQDGASNGLTAPNGPSQQRVIAQALASAGLEPSEVDAVEAHGTGTTLGDPIEAGALLATYGQQRERPLALGSIKSNIGHAQAAAGVAGVIKMVLAMREGVLPKTLHIDAPSSHVQWEEGNVELLSEARPWAPNGAPRRAGVSSFGISGTNAHVILEEAPKQEAKETATEPKQSPLSGPIALPLSAKSSSALSESASRLSAQLQADPELDLGDVAYSLTTSRSSLSKRAVILGSDRKELLSGLGALAKGTEATNLFCGTSTAPRLAYLLSGQGAQRLGMGKELYGSSPVFAEAFDQVCEQLDPHIGEPLKEIVFAKGKKAAAKLQNTTYAQPAIFALQVALAKTLTAFGLAPQVLCGHSIGEIGAAHLSGVLSLPDAAKLISARGALMGALPKGGAMLALQGTETEAQEAIKGKEAELSIAALNGPTSVVISGTEEAISQVEAEWQKQDKKLKRLATSHAFHSALMEPMLAPFQEVAQSLTYQEPKIPIISTLSGEALSATQATDPAYWVRQAREPVRFSAAIQTLDAQAPHTALELGPDAVLSALAAECVPEGSESHFAPLLREGRDEAETLTGALASANTAGIQVNWAASHPGAKRVPLPTYPFQRSRYWLKADSSQGDPRAQGQALSEHPMLGAAIALPEEEGWLFTGRLSTESHPWLEDHAVFDTVLLPGTAFLELALHAAHQAGLVSVEELTLQAPLILSPGQAVALQVAVGSPDQEGNRQISIHSRPEGADGEEEWTRHASGSLSPQETQAPQPLTSWPPEGAQPIETADLYERLAEAGFQYGPAFQGLSAAWRDGEEIYAEVALAPEQREAAGAFSLHPALLDSALHGALIAALQSNTEEEMRLPFSWNGVSLIASGATELRVQISKATSQEAGEGAISIAVSDQNGDPVASAASLQGRAISTEQLASASGAQSKSLFALHWAPAQLEDEESPADSIRWAHLGEADSPLLTALGGEGSQSHPDLEALTKALDKDEETPVPELVLCELSSAGEGETPSKAKEALEETLALAQEWIATERLASSRLVLITTGAVAAKEGEDPDLSQAPLWGLIRSAQMEHPERFGLIDTDGAEDSLAALPKALAALEAEPQLALREGVALAGRLRSAQVDAEQPDLAETDPNSTVLITGGTGGLGALLAEHLVTEQGAKHLLLISRSGEEAQGAPELAARLQEQGAKVRIAACDVADKDQLKALLDSIPKENPLGTVIHAAGVLDDGVIETLDPERLQRVMGPKANAAHHLHELTTGIDLDAFVMFSSIAGIIGGPGQGNYAAANSFLDALAQHRRAQGLVATSIAWGAWMQTQGMTASLSKADLVRIERSGIGVLSDQQGLELFEAALKTQSPLSVAIRLNRSALRTQASAGTLPALFRGLVRTPTRRAGQSGSFARTLASVPEGEREAVALEFIRTQIATVLGHDSPGAIAPQQAFKDMGFDSLAAVELRNRLAAATGMRLPATLVFDYPTPTALASHLLSEATASGAAKPLAIRATASEEPIAIIAMACRYPGGVTSPEDLWRLLEAGEDGISQFPTDRGWDLERLYDPDPDTPGTSYAREGGFLHEAADFDAEFFGISPREALATDPQQRLLLEACWEALEGAGIDPASLHGSATGVFAGLMYHDYGVRSALSDLKDLEGYLGVGNAGSVFSGRIAYALGLEGPAMTVDTACSSSLVTLHLAAQALRAGECSLALAGGATVMATPSVFTEFSRQRGLAPDGRCKSFAEAADGTGWSEGVGMLLVSRLSDAQRQGHPILAVLKGSAVNQDGASNGLTAPNGPSQQRVIAQALASAGLEPSEVDAVEAHGTGTTLGDPIEAGALLATYGQQRERPLALGSIKSNIGHAQAAAGVAGVIKMVLAMREGVLPKTLHIDAPSSHVQWSEGNVELLSEARPWAPNGAPRRAGVSSFGISGTNAHVILEEAPKQEAKETATEPKQSPLSGPIALPLSAKSSSALSESASRLSAQLQADPELDLGDVAYSLTTSRSSLSKRAVILGADRKELLSGLSALAKGTEATNLFCGTSTAPRLAYLLSGQGAQRLGMGKELYGSSPVFAEAFDQVCEQLDPHIGEPLKEIVFAKGKKAAAKLQDTTYAQPAIFALQVALAKTLTAFGLAPQVLCGHSIGEIGAAHLSGVLSLPDAAKLISARGALMGALPKGGAMLALQGTETEAQEAIKGKEAELSIAALNGPTSVVISGTEEAISQIEAEWGARDKKLKRLATSHAFHSTLMEPMLAPFQEVAQSLTYSEPKIPIISTLSGEALSATQATDPAYWVSQAREPVRFSAAIQTLDAQAPHTALELGPDAVLSALAAECVPEGSESHFAPLLREGRAEPETLVSALASANTAGIGVNWAASHPQAKRVPLPTYPFQRQRYWLKADSSQGDPRAQGQALSEHPMLGAAIALPEEEGWLHTGRLSTESHPWLADHAVFDTVLLPGTAFLELALHATEQAGLKSVEELTLQAPLILSQGQAVAIQVAVGSPDQEGNRQISIHSRPEGAEAQEEWTRHASGSLSPQETQAPQPLTNWPPEGAQPIETADLYERLAEAGFQYGPAFQGLSAAWRDGEEIYAEVALAPEQREAAGAFSLHPALLDAAFHQTLADVSAELASEGGKLFVPFSWSGVGVFAPGPAKIRVKIYTRAGSENLALALFDQNGAVIGGIDSLQAREISRDTLSAALRTDRTSLFTVGWTASELPKTTSPVDIGQYAYLDRETAGFPHFDSEALGLKGYPDLDSLAEAIEASGSAPEAVITTVGPDPASEDMADVLSDMKSTTRGALSLLQAWLQDDRFADSRLVLVTTDAVAARPAVESPSLALASLLGLVRSAQSENPGRIVLLDLDRSRLEPATLSEALESEESQLAIREGAMLVPRLEKSAQEPMEPTPPKLDPEGTVLITGGLSGLGALVAQHLVAAHGVKHLLLVSRRGPDAPEADAVHEELVNEGASVRVEACDVSDRQQLEVLIGSIPSSQPLTGVIHAAAVFDNSLVASMTSEQLDEVLRTKAEAALHLHELTKAADLRVFVLFSSMAGIFGGPGQGNYAAANSFLDALAQYRRANGLAGLAIAWGLWEEVGAGRHLGARDLARMVGSAGFRVLSPANGLALLDQALEHSRGSVVAAELDKRALRAEARTGTLAPLLTGEISAGLLDTGGRSRGWLAAQLRELSGEEREVAVVAAISSQVEQILGLASGEGIDGGRSFLDVGFDSLAAVQLRNWLNVATGVSLPASTVFDHPTPDSLGEYVAGLLADLSERTPRSELEVESNAAPSEQDEVVNQSVGLGSFFREAQLRGEAREGVALLAAAARLRPTFVSSTVNDHAPSPVRLAEGNGGVTLVCIPSMLATGGPHQYARFAKRLAGTRDVAAVSLPGYLEGEHLPATCQAALEAQAAGVRACVGDKPFVVMGHSTGGLLAHAVASLLEELGAMPAGTIQVDTYPQAAMSVISERAVVEMVQRTDVFDSISDTRLTAMATYGQLLEDVESGDLHCPTLLLRATEPLNGMPTDTEWRSSWSRAGTVLDAPGNHFTMMEDHADEVALLIDEWIRGNEA